MMVTMATTTQQAIRVRRNAASSSLSEILGQLWISIRINQRREILDAAVEAARLRFRPILMTSFAFILGVLPLVFASGAGANARRSIGITVASGMLASTCIAVLFVPAFFVVLQRLSERRARRP
jgi:hydrophobic/amphiphilic exporter-1 (mainly G- bacteria), HAE1 family